MSRIARAISFGLVAVAIALPSPATAQQAQQAQKALPADSLERVRAVARFLYAGEVDSLLARMSGEVQAQFGGREGLLEGITTISIRAGTEVSIVEERWNMRNGARQYWRTAKMSIMPEDFLLRIVIDENGMILGMGMGPARAAPPIESEGPVIPKP